MSSMVCHGLQSCLEPQASELKMVTTKLRLLKPTKCIESLLVSKSDESVNEKANTTQDDLGSNADQGGWSFIQALTNNSQTVQVKAEDQPKPYVHPHYTPSASHLSSKSLELCTETLGSETGSDNGGDIDIFSSSDSESNKSPTKHQSRPRRSNGFGSKRVRRGSPPPPLTSISGSNCLSIKPRREGGRLVMKAVVVPSSSGYFQAERRDGCLKLHYIKNYEHSPYSSDSDQEPHQEEQAENKGNEEEERIENGGVGGGGGAVEVQRPSRCKEGGRGNKGLLTWEPFWVAT